MARGLVVAWLQGTQTTSAPDWLPEKSLVPVSPQNPDARAKLLAGVLLIGRFTPRQLNFCIGLIAVLFVAFQFLRDRIFAWEGRFAPSKAIGVPFGIAAGVTSTFAHGAGPVVAMFLVAQRLPKEVFVGTNVLLFTWINWIKLPFFIGNGIISWETVRVGLSFLPLIPVGVWMGVWLNRRMSETLFVKVAYALILVAGLSLLFDLNAASWLQR